MSKKKKRNCTNSVTIQAAISWRATASRPPRSFGGGGRIAEPNKQSRTELKRSCSIYLQSWLETSDYARHNCLVSTIIHVATFLSPRLPSRAVRLNQEQAASTPCSGGVLSVFMQVSQPTVSRVFAFFWWNSPIFSTDKKIMTFGWTVMRIWFIEL